MTGNFGAILFLYGPVSTSVVSSVILQYLNRTSFISLFAVPFSIPRVNFPCVNTFKSEL